MTFATLGDTLKIFNVENDRFNTKDSINYANGNTIDGGCGVGWSGDGQWIVGPVENGGALPVFKFEKSNKLCRMRCIRDADATTAVFLNCTNRLLAVGSKSGAVKLWNIKDKKWHQTLCQSDTEAVKFMSVSADDMYVAAAGSYSQVKMYGLTTNKLVNTFTVKSNTELSALHFSPVKKNWLGCSSIEGSLIVWDVYKSVEVFNEKKTHIGACTGIAMSPLNHWIIASIALNDSFAIHDVRQKGPSLLVKVGAAGSCVELMKSEPYALIGSRDGRLLMYDLRSMATVCEETIHQKPVTCVRAVLMTNSKPYEDVPVNTPENEFTKQPCGISISEIFTPPSTLAAQLPSQQSRLVSTSLVDAISPITPAPGQHRVTIDKTTSTPNQPQFVDSLAKFFESPTASPAHVNTLLPFRQTPSPLTTSLVHRLQRPEILNGICEVSENEENSQSRITREDLANLKQELLTSVRNESERAMKQQIEMQQQFEKRMFAEMERNRFGIIQCIKEIAELRNVVRLEQIVTEFMEREESEHNHC